MILGIGSVLVLAHVYQFYLWLRRWSKWNPISKKSGSKDFPPVSVIIAAKNESENIPLFLVGILQQDYPHFEVIIIDDQSSDQTMQILEKLKIKYPQLQLLTTTEAQQGKKAAIEIGIVQSKNEWIVCIDADCYPYGPSWLKTLLSEHESADVILGYGMYKSSKEFLNQFLSYETWFIAFQYLTQAIIGKPYMAVGRNLAYRRKVFIENHGFESHKEIKSGDDDLIISNLKDAQIKIQIQQESWTISQAPNTWSALWQQKRRHLTTAPRYPTRVKVKLVLEFLSQFLIYSLTTFLVLKGMWYWAVVSIVFRAIYLYIFSKSGMRDLGVKGLHLAIPFWDLVLCLYYSFHSIGMLWSKKDW